MANSVWLSGAQMARIEPFPLTHGIARTDDPASYSPHKTLYNRFVRWSRLGVFDRIFAGLTGKAGEPDILMIDATHLKAHRTAASLFKKGLYPAVSGAQKPA